MKLEITPVAQCARQHQLPLLQPSKLDADKPDNVLDQIQNLTPDLIVVAAYGAIFPPELLRIPKLGCVNLHASLLPRYRGATPIEQALIAGDESTGVTLMLMDEGLDTGHILAQDRLNIRSSWDKNMLTLQLAWLSAKHLNNWLSKWQQGLLEPQPQNDQLASLTTQLHKSHAQADWREPASLLARKVRAYSPAPCLWCYTRFKGRTKMQILKARSIPIPAECTQLAPGQLFKLGKTLAVACGHQSALELLTFKLESGKTLRALDALNAQMPGLTPGQILS